MTTPQRQKSRIVTPRSTVALNAMLRSGAGRHQDSRRENRDTRRAGNLRAIHDSF